MTPVASQIGLLTGPTALDALEAPVAMASSWWAGGPPAGLVVLALLAIALLWLPDWRRPACRPAS
jgi:hypothetical protein